MKRFLPALLACVCSSIIPAVAGAQCIHGACGRADLNQDGCIGWRDAGLFLCQLAGGCGPGNCSDFNQDGDFGTDGDIEAFFAAYANPALACSRAPNDFCVNATNLGTALGTFPLDLNCASYQAPFNYSPPMWGDVWYRWTSLAGGPTRVTANVFGVSINLTSFQQSTCPSALAPIGVHHFTATSVALPNTTYMLRVGSEGADPIGGSGTLTVENLCPRPTGTAVGKMYTILGNGTGQPWAWRIASTANPKTFSDIGNTQCSGIFGSPGAVAQRFASDINSTTLGLGCQPVRILARGTSGIFTAKLAITTREPIRLFVGPAGSFPANCAVTAILPACSFNPDIVEEPVSGQDCNGNEWDDTIDIAFGDSVDVNGDGVPDECQCGTADFDGDGDLGTDADIEAFFACLGGSCCATCYPNGADFNNDGDIGTDEDIESFFRVLGGGDC
jgi:hypothetical protein